MKKKFDHNAAVEAVLKCVKNTADLGGSPTNPRIFTKICDYLSIEKAQQKTFKTNLEFAWRNDTHKVKTRIEKGLSQKSSLPTPVIDLTSDNEDSAIAVSGGSSSGDKSLKTGPTRNKRQYSVKDYRYIGDIELSNSAVLNKGEISKGKLHKAKLVEIIGVSHSEQCKLQFRGYQSRNGQKFSDYASCSKSLSEKYYKFAGHVQKDYTAVSIYATPGECVHDDCLAERFGKSLVVEEPHTANAATDCRSALSLEFNRNYTITDPRFITHRVPKDHSP